MLNKSQMGALFSAGWIVGHREEQAVLIAGNLPLPIRHFDLTIGRLQDLQNLLPRPQLSGRPSIELPQPGLNGQAQCNQQCQQNPPSQATKEQQNSQSKSDRREHCRESQADCC